MNVLYKRKRKKKRHSIQKPSYMYWFEKPPKSEIRNLGDEDRKTTHKKVKQNVTQGKYEAGPWLFVRCAISIIQLGHV